MAISHARMRSSRANINPFTTPSEVPGEVVRALLHTLGGTLWCYDDGGSRRLVRLVLGALCREYGGSHHTR